MSSSPSTSRAPDMPSDGYPAGNSHVELKDMGSAQQRTLPVGEDIMQLARLGEIGAIQKLFSSKKLPVTYADEQNITPLHWAAINNHYALCHFLIQAGVDVNAKGGEASATPVLWAAKRCNYYVVHLLLQHGADPLITDDEGFNLLHSATLDGNVFQLILLLHQDIPVDIPDQHGHTSLMWAAYKGFPACVDVLLRWGASVYARDEKGFTALHWALVRGASPSIQKLIEYGSDRFAETDDGKTPAVVAKDMNSTRQFQHALSDCGYNSDGSPKYFPLSSIVKDRRAVLSRFFFLWPFVAIGCCIYILSNMVIYAAVPIAIVAFISLQWVALQALRYAPADMKHMHQTPFLAGIFAGTLFWVGIRWFVKILPWTFSSSLFLNIFFAFSYAMCTYFYFYTMLSDPGYIPKPGSRNQQKAIIDELLEARKFDEINFCVHCMVRKPLRSKHCKRCGRCIAKEDHHCPWVDNCVANNNHRHFVLYLIFMEIGVIALVNLGLSFLEAIPEPENVHCNILSDQLCAQLWKDPFTIVLIMWSALQLVWVTMLVIVQLVQIARATTTFESMRPDLQQHTFGDAVMSFVATGDPAAASSQLTGSGAGPDPVRRGHQKQGCFEQWKRLLGVDTFMATAIHGSNAQAAQTRQRENPFTRGVLANCRDFWCDPAPFFGRRENGDALLGGERVNYARLYEAPPRMRMRREGGTDAAYVAVGTDEGV